MFKRSSGTLGRVDSPATRKKQKTSNGDSVQEEGRELLKAIDKLADKKTQRAISSEFQRLPSKKLYPDYYKLIKKPIALDVIQDNLDDGEYVTLDLLREDLLQMCNNAKRYNQKGSILYSDAAQIARLVKNWSNDAGKYSEDSDIEELTKEIANRSYRTMLNQHIKGILKELKEVKDRKGRKYIDIFIELPDRKLYPDYYTTITNPMSITSLEIRMKKNPYMKLEKFNEHMDLIWQNAYTYNDPKSFVAQDAKHLQKAVNKLIEEARPRIAADEQELIEQAKEQGKSEARTHKVNGKNADAAPSTGSFKIKLGLRQPSATPTHSPIPKVKLNLGGHKAALSGNRPSPVSSPALRKSVTPAPTPGPSTPQPELKVEKEDTPPSVKTVGQADETPLAKPVVKPSEVKAPATPLPVTPTVLPTPPPLPPAPVVIPLIQYANTGAPLVQFLSLCASQIQPPTILHIPSVVGRANFVYSWTLPMAASALTVSPNLNPSLLDGTRGYSLTINLNGRKVSASRQATGQTVLKNSIWDFRLSSGMNCIECITEAAEPLPLTGQPQDTSANAVDKVLVSESKTRERIVILALLR